MAAGQRAAPRPGRRPGVPGRRARGVRGTPVAGSAARARGRPRRSTAHALNKTIRFVDRLAEGATPSPAVARGARGSAQAHPRGPAHRRGR